MRKKGKRHIKRLWFYYISYFTSSNQNLTITFILFRGVWVCMYPPMCIYKFLLFIYLYELLIFYKYTEYIIYLYIFYISIKVFFSAICPLNGPMRLVSPITNAWTIPTLQMRKLRLQRLNDLLTFTS